MEARIQNVVTLVHILTSIATRLEMPTSMIEDGANAHFLVRNFMEKVVADNINQRISMR